MHSTFFWCLISHHHYIISGCQRLQRLCILRLCKSREGIGLVWGWWQGRSNHWDGRRLYISQGISRCDQWDTSVPSLNINTEWDHYEMFSSDYICSWSFAEVHAALAAALYVDKHAPLLAENQFTIATLLDPKYTDITYVRETKHWPPSLVSSLQHFITLS